MRHYQVNGIKFANLTKIRSISLNNSLVDQYQNMFIIFAE